MSRYRRLIETDRTITTADLRADVAAIACPTLVVHGDADRSAPLALTGQPTAALLRDARLHVMPGAGHGLYASCADEYSRALVGFAAGS